MCRKYKSDKIINKILENYFNEFREKKWHRVRKEMSEHITDIVKRILNCGNIEKGYIKHKSLKCNEEYIHGFTCKSKFCSKRGRKYFFKWSDLKRNPHIHALFTEGGIDKNNKWFKKVYHIPYEYLRKSWQINTTYTPKGV